MKKIKDFFISVKKEMAKVHFPTKKEMMLYSVATISFVLFFAAFFMLSDIVIAIFKRMVA